MPTSAHTRAPVRRRMSAGDADKRRRTWRSVTDNRLAVLVASVTQPFNVGAIMGSAAAYGVDYLWLAGNAALPTHPNAVKATLGAEGEVPWHHAGSVAEAVADVRDAGYRLVALELTGDAIPLHEAPMAGDICLAVGGEDHGCSPALLAEADAVTYIPQVGRVGSLNVAVATAIALAEIRRREWV